MSLNSVHAGDTSGEEQQRDAHGVDAEQDTDAVPCPFGGLGGVDAGVEPCGQACVAKIVWPASEWRRSLSLSLGQGGFASGCPDAAVDALGKIATCVPAEQAAVGGDAVAGDVHLEQFGEPGVAGNGPDFLDCAVLSWRRSRRVPVLVQARPTAGADLRR